MTNFLFPLGLVQGLKKNGWSDVPLVCMETEGANCLNLALAKGEVTACEEIASIAKSLGSLTVSQRLFDLTKEHEVVSRTVTDKQALEACLR